VAAHLLKRTAEILNLGILDRVAGGAFGFLKAVFIAQALLVALVTFPNPDMRGKVDSSPVATRLLEAAPTVLAFLPGTFDEGIDLFKEHIDSARGADVEPTPSP
jgi:uncharacterized membrane protein required for colicin V production